MATGKDTGDRRRVRSQAVDTKRQLGSSSVAARATYAGGISRFGGETIPVAAKGFDYTLRVPVGGAGAFGRPRVGCSIG